VIDRLDRDGGTGLRHRKDVYTRDLEGRQHAQRVADRWQLTVYSSTNSPNINPMTSIGTPARPCLSICYVISESSTLDRAPGRVQDHEASRTLSRASEEM
jgi:hypothetical protein